jgi:hypothetical protein
MWYAGSENGISRCSLYGHNFTHAGVMANMACCIGGGGEKSPTSASLYTPLPSPA